MVIDDRSNCEQFKHIVNDSGLHNIQYLKNHHEKGAGTCRNIGLKNAIGDYLIFADSDDYFTANAFSYIDDAVYKNKKAEIIFFKVTSKNYDNSVSQRHLKFCHLVDDFLTKKDILTEKRLRLAHHVPWGKIIKSELVHSLNITFDQTIVSNDVIFSLKTGQAANTISASAHTIYCVTARANSLTTKKDKNNYRLRLSIYAQYFDLLSDTEKRIIGASPLPILFRSFDYGATEFFNSIFFFRKHKIPFFKYYKPSLLHFKLLFAKLK